MKTTPFASKFIIDSYQITQEVLNRGYFILSKVPEVQTIALLIYEVNDILSDEYSIDKVDIDNQYMYPAATINQYVLSWMYSSSSSSSSSSDLDALLRANEGSVLHIRYISNT